MKKLLAVLMFSVGLAYGQTYYPAGNPTPMLRGTSAPSCTLTLDGVGFLNTSTFVLTVCNGATTTWIVPNLPFQSQSFGISSGLFSTATLLSTPYFEPNAVTLQAVVTREMGSPACTAAPVLSIRDLGTSVSTVYASATEIYSQTLSTSNTTVSNTGLSIAIAAGHYISVGLSAGTCVTPPTINTSIVIQ